MLVDRIIAYELGELNDENVLKLYAELIQTGMAWRLQGNYGRVAQYLIDAGHLSETGEIL